MIRKVSDLIEEVKDELITLNEYIANNPELGNEEVKACRAHVDLLRKHGFNVEEEYLGMKTAFRAEFKSLKPGPTIGYLSEYDALPEIGHGCGHCLVGTTGTGSGIVLSKIINDIGGKIVVLGTPAEETDGTKVYMTEKGAFSDIDVAMEAHPAAMHFSSGKSAAMEALQFTFKGKSTHAAVCPENGINALDAAINTFVNINALREHIEDDARIHGIIKEGGKAANIVPDLAIVQFYVRAPYKSYLKELVEKVKNCAKGASLAAGTNLEIINFEASYDNFITNETLSEIYCRRIKDMGAEKVHKLDGLFERGSLDAGNASHVCPMIHTYFGISDVQIEVHTKEFAEASKKPLAYREMTKAIGALVLTAVDVIQDENIFKSIKEEFEATEK